MTGSRIHPKLRHTVKRIAPGIGVLSKSRTKRPIVQVLNAFGKTKLEEKIAADLRRQMLAKLDKEQ